MARPKGIEATEEKATAEAPISAKANVINPLSVDFSREDLNALVVKINEIINYLNK